MKHKLTQLIKGHTRTCASDNITSTEAIKKYQDTYSNPQNCFFVESASC